MKKMSCLFLLLSVFCMPLTGCSLGETFSGQTVNDTANNETDKRYEIYLRAKEAGYSGTYEEWLSTIRGEKGEQGEQGNPGKDGLSILTGNGYPSSSIGNNGDSFIDFDTWDYYLKVNGIWVKQGNLKGQDGKNGTNGANGENGKTPYVGNNGNWWIGNTDTGSRASGLNGNDGVSIVSIEKAGSNENIDTYVITFSNNTTFKYTITNGLDGSDGQTPYIGNNGNWWIGSSDTCVQAEGKDGVSITNIYFSSNEMIISFSDNSYLNIGAYYNSGSYSYYESSGLVFELGIFRGKACATLTRYNEDLSWNLIGYSANLIIPSSFMGVPVVAIGNEFGYSDPSIKSISLPSTLVYIGERAFANCDKLESIHLPDSVEKIDSYAFINCSSLAEVLTSENSSLKSIGYSVFDNCISLKSINIPSSLKSDYVLMFYNCTSLSDITCSGSDNQFTFDDGVLYFTEENVFNPGSFNKHLVYYSSTKSDSYYKIESGLSQIMFNRPFNNNPYLEILEFPADLQFWYLQETIYDCALLKTLIFPVETDDIDFNIINNCPNYECTFYKGTSNQWNSLSKYDEVVLSHPVYFYSETSAVNSWHYVDGVPTLW